MSLQQDLECAAEIDAFCERQLDVVLDDARESVRHLLGQASRPETCRKLHEALEALAPAHEVAYAQPDPVREAAPDLLAALSRLVAGLTHVGCPLPYGVDRSHTWAVEKGPQQTALEQARAALVKARGELLRGERP